MVQGKIRCYTPMAITTLPKSTYFCSQNGARVAYKVKSCTWGHLGGLYGVTFEFHENSMTNTCELLNTVYSLSKCAQLRSGHSSPCLGIRGNCTTYLCLRLLIGKGGPTLQHCDEWGPSCEPLEKHGPQRVLQKDQLGLSAVVIQALSHWSHVKILK